MNSLQDGLIFLDKNNNICDLIYLKLDSDNMKKALPISYNDDMNKDYLLAIFDSTGKDYLGQHDFTTIDKYINKVHAISLINNDYKNIKDKFPLLDESIYNSKRLFFESQFHFQN